MELQLIADNKFYSLYVNSKKNRALLKIRGFWSKRESVPDYLADWKKATGILKENFTLLTDASDMKTHPQEVRALHEEAQGLIVKAGVRRIAEIVKDDVAEMQLNSMAKKTQLPKRNFRTAKDAELWLDE
jgi:hypothetical protein